MDELLEMFNTFIGEAFDREKGMEVEFMEFEKKLNDCVSQASERGTPVQNKKRPKRQVSISERNETGDSNRKISNKNDDALENGSGGAQRQSAEVDSAVRTDGKLSATRSSARMLNVTTNGHEPARTMETAEELNETGVRPSRSARLKAQEKLKELPLNSKIRNDGGAVAIKTERISTSANNTVLDGGKSAVEKPAPIAEQPEPMHVDFETENDANRANRIGSQGPRRDDEGFSSTNESSKKEEEPPSSRDISLLIIPPVVTKLELISDEEMPPPKMPPPKMAAPKPRTKKKVAAPEKQAPRGSETASSSAVSSANSTMSSTSEKGSDTGTGATRGRGRPRKNAPAKENESPVNIEAVRIKTEKLSFERPPAVAPANERTSGKSVYEDARSSQELLMQMRPLQVSLEKLPMSKLVAAGTTESPADLNGTYTVAQSASNGTFVIPSTAANGTFTVNSPMEDVAGPGRCDETFNIPTKTGSSEPSEGTEVGKGANALCNASIMTEDESVVENSPNQVPDAKAKGNTPSGRLAQGSKIKNPSSFSDLKKTSASNPKATATKEQGKHKELFNPCVMSPIKSRIEAFEKCATGTAASSKIGTPQAQVGRLLKTVSTPTLGTDIGLGVVRSAHAKPLASTHTPNCASQPSLPKASSASKISQMQSRAAQHAMATGVTRSQSRDSSCERATGATSGSGTLSAASSTSSLLDEKKKKREEKQRQAAMQREVMEREKREHAERLLREKEEKYQKLLQEKQEKLRVDALKKARKQEEFERRRQIEEQKAIADQKREELAKQLAEQQRIDRELIESLKQNQAKENHEVKLHKQLYQQKLRQQQQQDKKQLQQQQQQKKKGPATQQFAFEMIDTDDSTDEEGAEETNAQSKKKRPPLPSWCQNSSDYKKTLAIQGQIDTKVIDRLFSVQPMTLDLRQLFPSIDARKLKRNSSAIWRTPPRYSQLP